MIVTSIEKTSHFVSFTPSSVLPHLPSLNKTTFDDGK